MNIKSIDESKGEFSIYPFGHQNAFLCKNDADYDNLPHLYLLSDFEKYIKYYPIYYIKVSERIVLVKMESLLNTNYDKYGLKKVTPQVLNELMAYYKHKGWKSAFCNIHFPQMRVSFKGNNNEYEMYIAGWTPLLGREYWSGWKLKLGKNQNELKQEKIKSLKCFNEKRSFEINIRDSLSKILNNSNLSLTIKSQNLDVLKFIYLYKGNLKRDGRSYNDTISIYPFIYLPVNSIPYKVVIKKNNDFWGEIIFKDGLISFKHVTNLKLDEMENALNTFNYIKDKNQDLLFLVDGFGNRIWHVYENIITICQFDQKYKVIEADEFIHRFYYHSDLILEEMK
jgi:hypothetical protein